jgi:hypothetical protein
LPRGVIRLTHVPRKLLVFGQDHAAKQINRAHARSNLKRPWTERFPLRFKELEHVLIEKVEQLFRNML